MIEIFIMPIPIVFYRYGGKIRAKSVWIPRMGEDREEGVAGQRRIVERDQARITKVNEGGDIVL